MIVEEMISSDRVRHYSNLGVKIRQVETNKVYDDAEDVVPCRYTYEETDEPVDGETDAEDILNILLGGEE